MTGRTRPAVTAAVSGLMLGVLLVFVVGATASTKPPVKKTAAVINAELAKLYTAAKSEGSVTFYCAQTVEECTALDDAFMLKYPGVKVNMSRIVSATLATRFNAEKASHAPTADVVWTSQLNFLILAEHQGLTIPWQNAGIPNYPGTYPKKLISTKFDAPYELNLENIAWNTDLVPAGQEPKMFTDLTDPKWKGKIVAASPAVSSAIAIIWGTLLDKLGPTFLAGIKANNVSWDAGGVASADQKLAAGEFAVGANLDSGGLTALQKAGAHVAFAYPTIITGYDAGFGMNKKADHPSAARLFASFIVTPAASKAMFAANPGGTTGYARPTGITPLSPNLRYLNPSLAKQVLNQLGF